jgi:predicted ArsR family transcriptional regulator
MLEVLERDGTTSVPALTAELPITRQAVAKHLLTLDEAGLVERLPGPGREVRYRLAAGWDGRLARLKRLVEG